MPSKTRYASSVTQPSVEFEYYDTSTLIFHWLTAILVLVLFGTAMVWNYVTPHDHFWRPVLEATHVSLGIWFAVVILLRLIWRFTGMRHLPAEVGISGTLSRIMYWLLYILLVAQSVLGFVLRWRQGEDFTFFGWFTMPAILGPDRDMAHTFEELHNWVAWAIIILSAGHAAAALVHHYVLEDLTLRRMSFRRTVIPRR